MISINIIGKVISDKLLAYLKVSPKVFFSSGRAKSFSLRLVKLFHNLSFELLI